MVMVVVCPDSFKGSIDAPLAAESIADGWRSVRPDDQLVVLPQADGGEGTIHAIAGSSPGRMHRLESVTGPDGRAVPAQWFEIDDAPWFDLDGNTAQHRAETTAVCDLADSSGLPLMAHLDPLGATTYGLGEVMADAIDHGVGHLVIGLGGSASTDGGAGALQALGFRLLDRFGAELTRGGAALAQVARIEPPAQRLPRVTVLTDVGSPLLGPDGAAATFGPQKGALDADVGTLERALAQWAAVLGGDHTQPGGGAAGGVGYGFAQALGATITPGAPAIATLTGLTTRAVDAEVLITGEGSFDATSLDGKVVGHALSLADEQRTRRYVIAGRVALDLPGVETVSLSDLVGAVSAMAEPQPALRMAGALLARHFIA